MDFAFTAKWIVGCLRGFLSICVQYDTVTDNTLRQRLSVEDGEVPSIDSAVWEKMETASTIERGAATRKLYVTSDVPIMGRVFGIRDEWLDGDAELREVGIIHPGILPSVDVDHVTAVVNEQHGSAFDREAVAGFVDEFTSFAEKLVVQPPYVMVMGGPDGLGINLIRDGDWLGLPFEVSDVMTDRRTDLSVDHAEVELLLDVLSEETDIVDAPLFDDTEWMPILPEAELDYILCLNADLNPLDPWMYRALELVTLGGLDKEVAGVVAQLETGADGDGDIVGGMRVGADKAVSQAQSAVSENEWLAENIELSVEP